MSIPSNSIHPVIKSIDCPRCGFMKRQFPALSRADNRTKICSDCGTDEGLYCMVHSKEEFLQMSQLWMSEAGINLRDKQEGEN